MKAEWSCCTLLLAFFGAALHAQPDAAGWARIPGADRSPSFHEIRSRLALAPASAETVHAHAKELSGAPRTAASVRAYLLAIELLAERSGVEAWAFAQSHLMSPLPPRSLEEALLRGWTRREPDAAEEWLRANPARLQADDRAELMRFFLRCAAAREGPATLARARRLADAADSSGFLNNVLPVIEALVENGRFAAAGEVAAGLEPADVREAAQANLVSLAVEHRPELAIAWYRELAPGSERRGALFRLLEVLAARDFSAAVDFYLTLDAAEHSADAAETLFLNGRPLPLVASERLFASVEKDELDRVVGVALDRMNRLQPANVPWSWTQRLSGSAARLRLLRALLRAGRSVAQASDLVTKMEFLPESERAALLGKFDKSSEGK